MNTRHARVILTILRAGSFTAAARELGITQPTLSQTVRQIETQLDETIFLRGRSSIALTPAGECYVQAARRMIQAEDQLAEALSQLRGRTEGRLRIGLMPGRSAELIPQILDDFLSIYPGIRLIIREAEAGLLEQHLIHGELDMALLSSEPRNPRLEYRQVASEEIVLLAGKRTALAQRLASGTTIGLREADRERFILPVPENSNRRYFDELFSSLNLQPDVYMECDSVSTAMRACASAGLVMLCPFISLLCDSASMQKLSHYHLGTDAYLPPFFMAYPHESPLSPHAETLFSLLSSRFRAMTAYRA